MKRLLLFVAFALCAPAARAAEALIEDRTLDSQVFRESRHFRHRRHGVVIGDRDR